MTIYLHGSYFCKHMNCSFPTGGGVVWSRAPRRMRRVVAAEILVVIVPSVFLFRSTDIIADDNIINSIEAVQRSFTKRFSGLRDTSYADRLSLLSLQSLEHRRLISDLATCFNIVHGHCSLELAHFFTFSHNALQPLRTVEEWTYLLTYSQPIFQRPLLTLIHSSCQNQFRKKRFLQSCCPTMELPASWCRHMSNFSNANLPGSTCLNS